MGGGDGTAVVVLNEWGERDRGGENISGGSGVSSGVGSGCVGKNANVMMAV